MKRNEFIDIKNLDQKALLAKVLQLKDEIADLVLDKNLSKLKDLKSISKKKKDLAQILTVVKQKQLLEKLELGNTQSKSSEIKNEEKKDEKSKKVTKKKGK